MLQMTSFKCSFLHFPSFDTTFSDSFFLSTFSLSAVYFLLPYSFTGFQFFLSEISSSLISNLHLIIRLDMPVDKKILSV